MPTNFPAVGPVQVLSNVTTGTGTTSYLDNGMPKQAHSLSVVASAGCTAGAVGLAVSADTVNWAVPPNATVTVSAPGTLVVGWQGAARYVTATVSTPIVGGTISAWVESSVLS